VKVLYCVVSHKKQAVVHMCTPHHATSHAVLPVMLVVGNTKPYFSQTKAIVLGDGQARQLEQPGPAA
jgi:hypothetical protein